MLSVTTMGAYEVTVTWDEAWILRAPGVPGCHTYGRTLRQGRERIREALQLWTGEESPEFELRLDIPEWEDDIADVTRARAEYAAAKAKLRQTIVEAARALIDDGLSVGDTAELLGLSHQRISQLTRAGRHWQDLDP